MFQISRHMDVYRKEYCALNNAACLHNICISEKDEFDSIELDIEYNNYNEYDTASGNEKRELLHQLPIRMY